MAEFLSILVVEDNLDDLILLTTLLHHLQAKGIEAQLTLSSSLQEAIVLLHHGHYDLVITDLYLPDSQGINTFLELQKRGASIPIIIVDGRAVENLAQEAIKLGAQDYLPHAELTLDLLSRIIRHAIERHRLHENLKALSFADELTGIYNRRGFNTLAEQQISLARRTRRGFFLFLIDLDYLKQINDTHGHAMGDRALQATAHCLQASFRHHDIIARIGGDEFAVVAINASQESGEHLKQQLLLQVKECNRKIQEPFHLSLSIGKAYYDGSHDRTLDTLLEEADLELYHEKRLTHL